VGLRELLLGERPSEDIVAREGPATLWRVPEKAFRAAACQYSDFSLLLFQMAFGKLDILTQSLKVLSGMSTC
jgi:CRP-like cAMP-binding protein